MFEIQSFKGPYTVTFGNIRSHLQSAPDSVIIADSNVLRLLNISIKPDRDIVFEAGEETKTLATCERLLQHLMKIGFQRGQTMICIGGGTLQDLTAFAASVLFRGVDWEFIPTTLLAQCDSCIGSKTSINFQGYKNLLGGFHPPRQVIIDVDLLSSLPESEIKSGIGEMLHYFLLKHDFALAEGVVQTDLSDLSPYIEASLAIKKDMIERDEFDKGERNLFNYGHTFGHAIEIESSFTVNHGQAVTMGMAIANKLSLKKGLISKSLYQRMDAILQKNMPAYQIQNRPAFFQALRKDKKNTSSQLTCILLNSEYGIKTQVDYEEVEGAL